MKLSIVVPAHNEQDNIANVIERIERSLSFDYELVIVDDNSTDETAELVQGLSRKYGNIKLVHNKSGKGFANALKTGFSKVSTDIVIPVMADLCDDLDSIPLMLDKLNQGYDIVCGSRYIKGGARLGGSKVKGFLSFCAGRSLSFLLGLPTHDIANAFKMYRKKVIDSIDVKSEAFEISMEIPLKAYYSGFKIAEIPTVWKERARGQSNFRVLKLLPAYIKLYIWAVLKRLTK
ncbi:MAG: glycosyltransferase [Candidatus Omnitrophica bacterium]|nr:glycosyltransferase [Candidatus Omnitrophota bacterium]